MPMHHWIVQIVQCTRTTAVKGHLAANGVFSIFVNDVMFYVMEGIGQNQRRRVYFVQFAMW